MKWILTMSFLFLGFSTYGQEEKINVYVVVSEDCPICIYMTDRLRRVEETFREEVNFHLVFPVSRSNHKTISTFKNKYNLQHYQIILDQNQEWTKKMGATVTSELIITDTSENIVYQGRINDAYYAPGKRKKRHASNEMERNIKSALDGKVISKPWPSAIGCYVTFQ